MQDRFPAALEVAALRRRAESNGGFAAVLHKGDADRGAILLLIAEKGRHFCCLERILDLDKGYIWQKSGPAENAETAEIRDFVANRRKADPDLWSIELDIADAERFVAETTEFS
ncbi:DUF1491 family protein [Sphingomicrobium marinum]|uniref:DUF1491 family protein n=1 Tax=Sphingomicrobium marinum TaxID=1227950 RepID=UPI00223FA19C|nr:DUF1491 family protein [Sphingomicrobium marinum]